MSLKRILTLDDKTILLKEEKRNRCQARLQTKTEIHAVNGKRVNEMEWTELHMPLSTQQIQEKSIYGKPMGIDLLFKMPVSNKSKNIQTKIYSYILKNSALYMKWIARLSTEQSMHNCALYLRKCDNSSVLRHYHSRQ